MFAWDPDKNEVNKRRHHIAFEDALTIFDGPTLERWDGREDYGEERWVATGLMRGVVVVVVVYTQYGEVTRIISARKGGTYERKDYEAYLSTL